MIKILSRWKGFGYAASGRLGPGPIWCWLTRDGMAATGLGFPATRPSLGRLAHLRAILAARLWLQACCRALKMPMKAAFAVPMWGCGKAPRLGWPRGLGGDGAGGCG